VVGLLRLWHRQPNKFAARMFRHLGRHEGWQRAWLVVGSQFIVSWQPVDAWWSLGVCYGGECL